MRILFLFIMLPIVLLGQNSIPFEKKNIEAKRIVENVKIDGKLEESVWESAPIAKDFIQLRPDNGKAEDPNLKTQVRILYDDNALYIGAEMFDHKPDSILTQLTARDQVETADFFLLSINPYNDEQQDFYFLISASGVQYDAFATQNEEDGSWDAVWESAVTKTDKGWFTELKIPYSALRFPKKQVSEWSVNFSREIKRSRTRNTWNFVDPKENNWFRFEGKLLGIKDIKPPTRLFIIPYTSAYYNVLEGKSTSQFKAGADIKWGINDAFTLDAILIPDFGQTAFDNTIYQLGPFEQEFDERRPFFTEGNDLFKKGNMVYSRRIGQIFNESPTVSNEEKITEYPSTVNLLNALKISGRTSKGWGIGVMNAITEETKVNIKNTLTNETREAIQSPLTNYNVITVDKRFGSNSISLTNTNVSREGEFRDANVTGVLASIFTKKNKYKATSELKFSHINDRKNKNGHWMSLDLEKVSGQNTFGLYANYVSKDYEINDLGINFYTNYSLFVPYYNYKIVNPTKFFNQFNINSNIETRINNTSGKFELIEFKAQFNFQSKQNNFHNLVIQFEPFKTYDHYEPRTDGRYMRKFRTFNIGYLKSPNYNKKFLIDWQPSFYMGEKKDIYGWGMFLGPRWRPNDHFLIYGQFNVNKNYNDYGYVKTKNADIIIGERDQLSSDLQINASYTFNPKTSLSLSVRHYWTTVEYNKFNNLLENGEFEERENYTENHDFSYNNWNVDFSFNWWFAPGSQLSFLYRNTTTNNQKQYNSDFKNNLDNLFKQPLSNTLSLRLTYFIDYNKMKSWFKK